MNSDTRESDADPFPDKRGIHAASLREVHPEIEVKKQMPQGSVGEEMN
jgi:hypothetical protein